MRIIYDNKTLTAGLSSVSGSAFFPETNLQSPFFYETYRSTALIDQRIVLNLASLQANYVYLRNYNFTSSVTLRIEANTSDSWGAPAFSQVLSFDSEYIIGEFTSATYDYWSLYIDDPTNTNSYIELGGLILGQSVDMPGMSPDQVLKTATNSTSKYSVSRNLYGNEDINFIEDVIKFPAVSFDEKKTVLEVFNFAKNVKPILMILWENALDLEAPLYCNIKNKTVTFQKSAKRTKPFATSLEVGEVF